MRCCPPLTFCIAVGKIAMAAKVLFTMAAFFIRTSLICFYYRLTADTGLFAYKKALHAAMAFNIAVMLAFVPLSIFQCT